MTDSRLLLKEFADLIRLPPPTPPWVMKGWVTIGAKDGEGGTPVFMDGGKVTRGPKALVGERIGGKPKGKDRPAETKPAYVADRHKALAAAMPELTDDEMEAAGEYVSGAYKVINGALREGRELKAGERGAKYLKTLDAAIDRAPVLDEPVTVHRGMKFQGEAADKFLARARALAESGDTLTDPAYGSATIDPDIAHDWVKAGDGTKVVMQIEASKGLYLGESAGGSKEKEFLLPRGTQYRILGVEERDGVHYVRAEQVVTEKGLACPWVVKLIDASGHEHAADGRFGSGGGKVAAADEPASHPSRSSRSVVHAATASLPDHVKDSPAKLDKVLRAAANLHVKLYPKLMKLGLLVHEFAPEILDTAEDFESIAKAKTGTGRPMGAATGNDPIYDATGMPGYWVLGSLVPKIAGAVAGYMARKKKAHDPWTAEKFAEVAKATRKLWAEAVRATGARFPLPSESEIIAHLERKHGATADDETGPDVDDPSDRAPRAAEKSALPGLAVSPPWVMKEAAFDESKHPRDHGQFSSKPGAKGGENKGPPTEDDE